MNGCDDSSDVNHTPEPQCASNLDCTGRDDADRQAFATRWAYISGTEPSPYPDIPRAYPWWLRSLGMSDEKAAYVDESGYISYDGHWRLMFNRNPQMGIRPAMWLKY